MLCFASLLKFGNNVISWVYSLQPTLNNTWVKSNVVDNPNRAGGGKVGNGKRKQKKHCGSATQISNFSCILIYCINKLDEQICIKIHWGEFLKYWIAEFWEEVSLAFTVHCR